jgi:hypothetical protein
MRRLSLLLIVLTLTAAALAAPAERTLVYIQTAGEDGPAFTAVGLELAAEVPGGYLAFLDDAGLGTLTMLGTPFRVVAVDDPATDVLVQYGTDHRDRHVAELLASAEELYRDPAFRIVRLPHDEQRMISCFHDIQRVFRRPLRFVTTPWQAPAAATSRDADSDIQAMVDTINEIWCRDQVQILEDFGTRHSQYEGGELASYWLRDQFLSYGYSDVTLHDYNGWNDNVVCIKPGSVYPDRYVVIGAHYDSISSDFLNAPGADDNATGTMGVLAAARAMAPYPFQNTVVFIAFSGEEQGLVGSNAWASEAADAGLNIIGAVTMDLLGYRAPDDTADLDVLFNGPSRPMRDLVDLAVADYVPDHVTVTGTLPYGASSDHAAFWNNGFRAILLYEDSNQYTPYLHTADDVVGLSVNDLPFLEKNVRTATATLAMMAEPFRIVIEHDPLPHTAGVGPFEVQSWIVGAEALDPAGLALHYRIDGGAITSITLAATGEPDTYTATIPAQALGTRVEYYIAAADELGRTATAPAGAPDQFYSFHTGVATILVDDAETDTGWTLGAPGDLAHTGLWIWADPVGTAYQPEDDHTPAPGHLCFVTGNADPGDMDGREDVDGGHTTLLSPLFDLSGASWAEVAYWRYYVVELTYDEVFQVDISSDGGQTWSPLETVTHTAGWTRAAFDLFELGIPLTDQMQLRFIAEDTGTGSLVEALVDDLVIVGTTGGTTAVDQTPTVAARLTAHPNPFNPQTTLAHALPRAGFAELAVYDARGRQVARPVSADQPAGAGEVAWNAEGLASGVYMVQLRLDGEVLRGTKLTLVR